MRLDGKDEAPWQEQMKRSGVFGLDQGPFTVPPPLPPHTHSQDGAAHQLLVVMRLAFGE